MATPENRLALGALQELADSLGSMHRSRFASPLFMFGPAGTGKSFLLASLEAELLGYSPRCRMVRIRADAFDDLVRSGQLRAWQDLVEAELLLFDDVHLLRVRSGENEAAAAESLVHLFDERMIRGLPMVATADTAPGQLSKLPRRLAGRLASGVTVSLLPLRAPSRLQLLQAFCQRRQVAVAPPILQWLAEHLGGSIRELEGAVSRLQALSRLSPRPLDLATTVQEFTPQVEAATATVERIAEGVGSFFRIESRQLRSRRRFTRFQLPRQIGMYLARQLTKLSLKEIGSYFGGRDHSTVLHACHKIEQALAQDPQLGGAIRKLRNDLGATLCNTC